MSKVQHKTLVARKLDAEDGPRVARRVVAHMDVFKALRIFAGDTVVIKPAGAGSSTPSYYAIGTAWPSIDVDIDCELDVSCHAAPLTPVSRRAALALASSHRPRERR